MSETYRDNLLMYGEMVSALDSKALAEYLRQMGFGAESRGRFVEAQDENGAVITFMRAYRDLSRVTGAAPTLTRMEESAARLSEALACAGIQHTLEVHASPDEMTTYTHPEGMEPEE